jgi:hypothetical protein
VGREKEEGFLVTIKAPVKVGCRASAGAFDSFRVLSAYIWGMLKKH